ncbi:MAG TPA: DNA-3-methyladenine glycosylase [Fimbriimonadaceae bacterium]
MKNAKKQLALLEALRHDVVSGAEQLLGAILVRGNRRARIVEVEAYRQEDDPGSHAFRGLTPRNQIMFGKAGVAYVYFNYGCHWMLNVTANAEGRAAAVLIRAAEPLAGLEEFRELRPKVKHDYDLLSGPGKLAAGFGITKKDYGIDLFDPSSDLRIEAGAAPTKIVQGIRIGLALGKGEEIPWRFVDGDAGKYVSKPHSAA